MTARALPEWIGKTPDTPAPPRVRARVFDRAGGRCHRCKRKITTGERWTLEHMLALANGGENAEHNLDVTCGNCLPVKNAEDVAQKARNAKVRAHYIGVRETKQPLPGGRRTPWKRKINGAVVRRDEE